jgi:membrane protease subunit HflC
MARVASGLAALLLLGALILAGGMLYIVDEAHQVVITQFGEPIGAPITAAGLHVKRPFVQQAHYFDKRLIEWDGVPTQIPTKDKKFILIDELARWRITDPLLFLQTVGNELGAQARLNDIIASATRDVVTGHILQEMVRSSNRLLDEPIQAGEDIILPAEVGERIEKGRDELTRLILARASELIPSYGIELMDMRIKRINYIEEVREKIYDRMVAERKQAAEKSRSEGQGKRAEIEGQMEKELKIITSEAYRKAQEIKGQADAEATQVYAEALGNDPEFYMFLKTLESYRATVDENSTLILTTDSDYFRYLKRLTGGAQDVK